MWWLEDNLLELCLFFRLMSSEDQTQGFQGWGQMPLPPWAISVPQSYVQKLRPETKYSKYSKVEAFLFPTYFIWERTHMIELTSPCHMAISNCFGVWTAWNRRVLRKRKYRHVEQFEALTSVLWHNCSEWCLPQFTGCSDSCLWLPTMTRNRIQTDMNHSVSS